LGASFVARSGNADKGKPWDSNDRIPSVGPEAGPTHPGYAERKSKEFLRFSPQIHQGFTLRGNYSLQIRSLAFQADANVGQAFRLPPAAYLCRIKATVARVRLESLTYQS